MQAVHDVGIINPPGAWSEHFLGALDLWFGKKCEVDVPAWKGLGYGITYSLSQVHPH